MDINFLVPYIQAIRDRYKFNQETQRYLDSIVKGYEGEQYIINILKTIPNLTFAHHLEFEGLNKVQIDILVVLNETIYILEIKNYYGDFYFKEECMINFHKQKYPSTLLQLRKSIMNLKEILLKNNINIPVKGYVIFTNPNFTIHNHFPDRDCVLLHSELHKLPKIFHSHETKLTQKILDKILKLQNPFSHKYKIIDFPDIENIKKGVRCPKCKKLNTVNLEDKKKYGVCTSCKKILLRTEVYYFNLLELAYLKRQPFTVKEAVTWLETGNRETIRKVCQKYFISNEKRYCKYWLKPLEK